MPLLRLRDAGPARSARECHFAGIRYSGLGTQRLEAEVRARFPDVPALRMDTDTMQAPRQPRAGARRVSRRARCASCWARR